MMASGTPVRIQLQVDVSQVRSDMLVLAEEATRPGGVERILAAKGQGGYLLQLQSKSADRARIVFEPRLSPQLAQLAADLRMARQG